MKKLYWHSHRFSPSTLFFVCLLAFISLVVMEKQKTDVPQENYQQKLKAVLLTEKSMKAIKIARLKKRIPIQADIDPQRSGLIGESFNYLTANHGSLNVKQTTINPNFAALIVSWMKKIGLKKGDTIAIGMNGSYPALNIAVLAATKTLELKPIMIVNLSTTQWGANIPKLLWTDMLAILNKKKLIPYTITAAFMGGTHDNLQNVNSQARDYFLKNLKKYNIPIVLTNNTADGIGKRIKIFEEQAHKNNVSIKAYINVGAVAAVYEKPGKHTTLKSGLNMSIPVKAATSNSVLLYFMKNGVPVINLVDINKIAEDNDLPIAPLIPPAIGQGSIFFEKHYNPYLAFGFLFVILSFLIIATALNKARFNRHYNSGIQHEQHS